MGRYTEQEILDLADAVRRRREDYPDKPYSLLLGAGCSKSAGIPLAGELVEEIRERYPFRIRNIPDEHRHDYGAHMAALSGEQAKAILHPHLRDAKVNWAHLAIASMIRAGFIGRVLTFNFDDVLARAC